MMRIVATLGFASCVCTALGQVYLPISNYNPPYNQVVWDASVPVVGDTAVNDASVGLTLWVAYFHTTDESLLVPANLVSLEDGETPVPQPFTIDTSLTLDPGAGYGGGGFYSMQALPLNINPPTLETNLTIQLRASGNTSYGLVDETESRSALYHPDIDLSSGSLPEDSIGLTVVVIPEPTTFALLGLGTLALVMGRRRSSFEN